ncbi:Sugar isomerase, KpsF/GutQ [Rasamsonia emersonii CBS 393.64]|uniref:Sugar isomerase, KpsF/GutQ n=1 Tax=Rasamsonia emersonii (strain ATCC 16479 / CBS 393.64 / IMI 116815) TaxID=1408163 RepID=A0A0F4YKB3_RASE3|nr:Sugar isomerase, KpsF/GutQ [Rasamsonia emersonii CBS 393.64]KKA18048.1 Sugar isomerase, KpsF/GutQ [Rasamsonia emersonii CBS 393.64]
MLENIPSLEQHSADDTMNGQGQEQMNDAPDKSLATALHVISTEREALANLESLYQTNALAQENISRAVSQIVKSIKCGGKLVVCGVGKSGKIGRKLEATMNSMGIYSVFLHPTEALHGDLGMIRPIDTLLLISFSGRTPELLLLLPHIPQTVPVIAITAHMHPSTCPILSYHRSDMTILLPAPVHVDEETSFGVSAPTTSTTVALALGDALALATARSLHTTPGRGPAEVISDLAVSADKIPTVVAAAHQQVRVLDILLTALQHPAAQSWVKLSPTEIIPPARVRALAQEQAGKVDAKLTDLDLPSPISVSAERWFRVSASSPVEDVRRWVADAMKASPSPVVIGVMDDYPCAAEEADKQQEEKFLGFVCGEDLCASSSS